MSIRVVIAADHGVIRKRIRDIPADEGNIVVMDINMPERSGQGHAPDPGRHAAGTHARDRRLY